MNSDTKKILDQINAKTKEFPLFYASRDIERSVGMENLIENYFPICIENSYIEEQLSAKGLKIFCAEKNNVKVAPKTTLNLLKHKECLNWINSIASGKVFFTQFFQFNEPAYKIVEKAGGKVLNNHSSLNRIFENKISQYQKLRETLVNIPKTIIAEAGKISFAEAESKLGSTIVVQMDVSHTGAGTYFIDGEVEFNILMQKLSGNFLKFSEYIKGDSYTINGCIAGGKIFVAGLQYQITGIPELTLGKGSTVGNDWSYANSLDNDLKQKVFNQTSCVGEILKANGYRGLFGIDLIISRSGDIFVIEINARQTANIPMQTKLELLHNQTPLSLLHLAEFLEIPIDIDPKKEINNLFGSQVFLRAKENFKINHMAKSGIYRLQSDNSAINWDTLQRKENIIYLDEEMDKPLIYQKDGFSVEQIDNGGFVLLNQPPGQVKLTGEELSRMQFKEQIFDRNGLKPWILEAFAAIEHIIK